jgi:hypothetical protein
MTDIEADALDEKWTANPPEVGTNGTGFFACRKEVMEYIEKYGETIESSGKPVNFNLRAAIEESKRLGRPLTLKEMDKYENAR